MKSPSHRPTQTISSTAPWAQQRRLEFIDFRLLWERRINRRELVTFFGISVPQASLDIARYIDLAPQNLEYDRRSKFYRATDQFRPIFSNADSQVFLNQLMGAATGVLPTGLSFVGWTPPYDVVRLPTRSIQPELLTEVLKAIRNSNELEISYQSMRHAAASRRWIVPHAIASDGFRWHVRAWCHRSSCFRDFVFARIQRIHEHRRSDIDTAADVRWHTMETVELRARGTLTPAQRRVVEHEFEMNDGSLKITMRQALVPYLLRRLQLVEGAETAFDGILECVNASALAPLLGENVNTGQTKARR